MQNFNSAENNNRISGYLFRTLRRCPKADRTMDVRMKKREAADLSFRNSISSHWTRNSCTSFVTLLNMENCSITPDALILCIFSADILTITDASGLSCRKRSPCHIHIDGKPSVFQRTHHLNYDQTREPIRSISNGLCCLWLYDNTVNTDCQVYFLIF